jgi:DNA-binding PadR family transcriptional regulator
MSRDRPLLTQHNICCSCPLRSGWKGTAQDAGLFAYNKSAFHPMTAVANSDILAFDKIDGLAYYIRSRYIRCRYFHLKCVLVKEELLMAEITLEPEEMLPLTPAVFHILLALTDGEHHGYGIMKEVETHTQGQVKMGPGTLYGSIKRMLAADLIEETDDRPDPTLDDERRRYYRLTEFGERVLAAEAQRLVRAVQVVRSKKLLGAAIPSTVSGEV